MAVKASVFVGKIFLDEAIKKREKTVDQIIFGREDKEVFKVATCMVITPDVLKDAIKWGADLIVTHEPTFYRGDKETSEYLPYKFKKDLLEKADITVCRWHDSPHYGEVDLVSAALINRMDWKGTFDGKLTFIFDEPITPLQIAADIRDKINLKYPRIVGRRDGVVKKMSIQLGARGSAPYFEMLENDVDLALCGEFCEWSDAEPIRDMAQIGMQKTVIVLGHAGSEKDAMKDLADCINKDFCADGITAKYFDCGELYSYID